MARAQATKVQGEVKGPTVVGVLTDQPPSISMASSGKPWIESWDGYLVAAPEASPHSQIDAVLKALSRFDPLAAGEYLSALVSIRAGAARHIREAARPRSSVVLRAVGDLKAAGVEAWFGSYEDLVEIPPDSRQARVVPNVLARSYTQPVLMIVFQPAGTAPETPVVDLSHTVGLTPTVEQLVSAEFEPSS